MCRNQRVVVSCSHFHLVTFTVRDSTHEIHQNEKEVNGNGDANGPQQR